MRLPGLLTGEMQGIAATIVGNKQQVVQLRRSETQNDIIIIECSSGNSSEKIIAPFVEESDE